MDNKKFYRIDYKFVDLEKGVDEDYTYVGASSPTEAIKGIIGTDFTVREASPEETEAYVRGFEDGFDIALINERMKDIDSFLYTDLEDLD